MMKQSHHQAHLMCDFDSSQGDSRPSVSRTGRDQDLTSKRLVLWFVFGNECLNNCKEKINYASGFAGDSFRVIDRLRAALSNYLEANKTRVH
jgi:hypothetical protein